MFPMIPLLAIAAMLGGGGVMGWYMRLSAVEKAKADRLSTEYAAELFNKAADRLTAAEARQVNGLVRRHFDN